MSRSTARAQLAITALPLMVVLFATPGALRAQAATEPTVQTETARIKAEAELERARADRDRARVDRITALGLPSFEGKTTMGEGAGAMEATMLASHAVRAAAAMIASDGTGDTTRPVVVLAGDEALDFGRIGALGAEMDAIRGMMMRAMAREGGGFAGAAALISAATAAAGLLRSDTDVAALDASALSNRVLAGMVAGQIGTRAILPSAAIGSLPEESQQTDWTKMSLLQKLNALVTLRDVVDKETKQQGLKPVDPEKPTKAETAKLAPYVAALARFDAFYARVTTADAAGALPIVQTVRLERILNDKPQILRVYMDKVGGTRVTRKNIGTTLTFSPAVKISGGLVASYSLTEPATGRQIAYDLISCRTAFTTMSSVQSDIWGGGKDGDQRAVCRGRNGTSITVIRDSGV